MSERTKCEICGASTPQDGGQDTHGVWLCLPCARGDNDARLGGLGWSFQRVTHHRNRGGSIFAAHVSREARLDLQVTFRRESLFSKLAAKLGRGDMEIGMAEFDDAVLIEVEDHQRATVSALLEDPVVRGAILSMLAQTRHSRVEIINGMVSGAQRGTNVSWPSLEEWVRDALVINWRMARREQELIEAF
jgi:hypothetical protein